MEEVYKSRKMLKERLDLYRVEYEGLQRMYERYMSYAQIAKDAVGKYIGNWSPQMTKVNGQNS